jgi:hypothetical protein
MKTSIKKVEGVNYSITDRWEKGIDHHPKSESLMKEIEKIDYNYCNDYFCWKTGGDGDNGETLMYILDIMFDEQDALERGAKYENAG